MTKIIIKTMAGILVIFIVGTILALPVMWLWNLFMPVVFELPKITFLQSLEITILCGILFKK